MAIKDHKDYIAVPVLFGIFFLLIGISLNLLLQVTGGDYFFSSPVDRFIYFVYESAFFLVLGTIVGYIFYNILRLAEFLFRTFRIYRENVGSWRIALSVFVIVSLLGIFLSNNILIQGGYRFNVLASACGLCIAFVLAFLAGRFQTLFIIEKRGGGKKVFLAGVCLAFIIIGLVRFVWVGQVDPFRSSRILHEGSEHEKVTFGSGHQINEIDNVIIILQDALRADHLSLYGYRRETSPNIDAWAQGPGSIIFDKALTPKTKTSPAIASLFTGLLPQSHGVYYCAQRLEEGLVTLAEILREKGYKTASMVGNKNASSQFNFNQGFDHAQSDFSSRKPVAKEIVDASMEWLENLAENEKFFLYLHFIDTHTPYEPPLEYTELFLADEWSREFKDLDITMGSSHLERIKDEVVISGHETDIDYYISMYDSEIRYFDDELRRLFDYLDDKGLSQRTLIVFTADHGESLTEHNYFFAHGSFVYQPTARIPMIFHHGSFGQPKRSDALISLMDVAPTIIDLLNHEVDVPFEGITLQSVLRDTVGGPEYVYLLGGDRHEWVILHAITDGRWKLVYNPIGLSRTGVYTLFNTLYPRNKTEWLRRRPKFRAPLLEYQLYDLANDPDERDNLITKNPDEADRLKHVLFSGYFKPVSNVHGLDIETTTLDEKTLENLRALGYIQ